MNQTSVKNINRILSFNWSFLKPKHTFEDSTKAAAVKLMLRFTLFGILFFTSVGIAFFYLSLPVNTMLFPVAGILMGISSIYLIYNQRHKETKYILSILPPYLITFISLHAKINGVSVNVLMYLIPNMLIILMTIIPVVMFGLYNKKELLISLLAIAPTWFIFNPLHDFYQVGYHDLPFDPNYYVVVILFFSLLFALVFYSISMLQGINVGVKKKLIENLEIVKTEKKTIENLNEDLMLQSNLYKVLNMMSDTQDINSTLNEVLTQILKVRKLNFLNKGIIFLKDDAGVMDVVAQKNVSMLEKLYRKNDVIESMQNDVNKADNTDHDNSIAEYDYYVEPILEKDGSVLGIINVFIDVGQTKDDAISNYLKAVANILSVKIANIEYYQNLLKQKNQILAQKNIIDETFSSLMESLEYAQSLQNSLLPTEDELENSYAEHFVMYMPKDTVSGDFYFSLKTKDKVNFSVGDCTGHGVPGAILASNSMENLRNVIFYNQEAKPNVILEIVRSFNEQKFKKSATMSHNDSLDAALCEYNYKEKKLYYAGGFIDLVIIRNGELIVRKATRNPVGVYPKKKLFELHTVPMEEGDIVYLFSDGIYDQFGSEKLKNNKLKRKIFYQWLLEVCHLPLAEQKSILQEQFINWKDGAEQTDDVTLFAVKVI